jgi:hypothetical protein
MRKQNYTRKKRTSTYLTALLISFCKGEEKNQFLPKFIIDEEEKNKYVPENRGDGAPDTFL